MSPPLQPLDDHEAISAEVRQRVARGSTLVSVVVNIVLTVLQLIAGIWAHSQALVADAIHSLSDLVADFVVLLASRHSRKGPDADHHYGHHRYETAASMVLGVLLLSVGVGMLWSAVGKLSTPESIPDVKPIALYVAVFTLLSKEFLFRYMLHAAERVRSSMLVANAWHSRSDAASSLVVALGIAGNLAGYPVLDAVAALVVGLLILRMGGQFAWRALDDLMDRAADTEHVQQIEQAVRDTPGVLGFHDLRTRKMGDLILVDVHIEVQGEQSVAQAHDIAVAVHQRILACGAPVLDVMTHLDPA